MTTSDASPNTLYADLHAHTTASDGTLTPTQLIQAAQKAGLSYLAVTDHDTTAGVAEAVQQASLAGIHLIPGVELSAEGTPGKCHLLGFGIRLDDAAFQETLADLSQKRRERNGKIVERFRSLGVDMTLEEVQNAAPPGANLGRPHMAQVLVNKGVVRDFAEAFARFLGDGGPAYVEKAVLSPADAIRLIHGAGGLCFLAHPGLLKLAPHETHETRINALQELGLDGIEAYYGMYAPVQTDRFLRLAQKRGLLVTGGSDFHGANKPDVHLGAVRDGERLPADLLPPRLLALAHSPN